MNNILVFEDNKLIQDINFETLWDGLFSKLNKNGNIIKFINDNLPKDTIFAIPHSDGNIKKKYTENEAICEIKWEEVQYYIDYTKSVNKIFILGLLSQIGNDEEGINYLYLPLDDAIFENGIENYFPQEALPLWHERSNKLCWRGGCSGVTIIESDGAKSSLRINFVKTLFDHPDAENVRLSNWWSEGKNIDPKYFADRIHYTEFLKYKIFFIVDGNVIASNHMWGFASGCVPFLISNAKCWFIPFIQPYVHYIPINYDLSNLIEQIEFIQNNDAIAEQIAKNALAFSREYFSSEGQKKYLLEKLKEFY